MNSLGSKLGSWSDCDIELSVGVHVFNSCKSHMIYYSALMWKIGPLALRQRGYIQPGLTALYRYRHASFYGTSRARFDAPKESAKFS